MAFLVGIIMLEIAEIPVSCIPDVTSERMNPRLALAFTYSSSVQLMAAILCGPREWQKKANIEKKKIYMKRQCAHCCVQK